MGRRGRKQKAASKSAKSAGSPKTKRKPPDSELEEGEIPETDNEQSSSGSANTTPEKNNEEVPSTEDQPEITTGELVPKSTEDPPLENSLNINAERVEKAVVEKTGDYEGNQLAEDRKTTEETDYGHSSCSSSTTIFEKQQNGSSLAAATTGAEEKTTGSKEKQTTEPTATLGSNEKQAAEPPDQSMAVEKAEAETTDLSKEVDKANGSNGTSNRKEKQSMEMTDGVCIEENLNKNSSKVNKDTAIQQETNIDTSPYLDGTPTYIRIVNISSDTTQEDLINLFGLHNTPYLRDNVRITLFFDSKGQYKGYAILRVPKHVRDLMIKLDGTEFKKRKLHIIDINLNSLTTYELRSMSKGLTDSSSLSSAENSITPYNPKQMSQGKGRQNLLKASEHKGELRPASHALSRREGSVSSTNRVADEFGEIDSEEVGGGKTQHATSMAQVARDGHNRQLMEERRRCQLLMDIFNNDEGAPPPSASMVYKIVTEKLGLSDDPSNGVNAIYRLDPSNPWKWFVLFISEDLKNSLEGKEGILELTHKKDKTKHTYYFKTKKSSVPAKSIRPLMITIQSSPLISNEELGSYLQPFGKIQAIVEKKYDFAKHVDTGLRMIFITLNRDVKARDLPTFLRTSDGVRRKLFFKGKLYICRDCGTKHTFTEGCPPEASQQDQQKHEQNVKITETIDIPQQKHNTEPCGRNRTHSLTRKHTKTTREHTNTTQQPNKQTNITRDKNDKGVEDMRAGTPMITEEVDFPLSPCVISKTPYATPVKEARDKPPFSKNREIDKLTKSVDKVKTKILSTPQRKVKPISPCCISNRPPFRF